MVILTKARIYKQWMLTVIIGSIIYTTVFGAEMAGILYPKFTLLEKVHSYIGCLLATLLYSSIAGGVALYINRLIYHIILCESVIKSTTNWLVFLMFPPIVSTVLYCAIFPLLSHGDTQ